METIKLWLADIRKLADREQAALPLLTPNRRAQAERIKPEQDRLHTIAAGLLLRRMLAVTADCDLRENEFGKRALAGEGPCFNLSHGGSYAVLAVFHAPVGVDIEPVGVKPPIAVPRRYLQQDELEWLEENSDARSFAWLWTRLESALKADGRGFGLDRRGFSVLESGQPWFLETMDLDGHVISCAAAEPFDIEVNQLPAEELLA